MVRFITKYEAFSYQNGATVHSDLAKFFNGAVFSKKDFIASIFSPSVPLKSRAQKIINNHNRQIASLAIEGTKKIMSVTRYVGNNPFVRKMMLHLEAYLGRDLLGAYVHGSLGTYEEIPYSDFDALAIIKNSVFKDRKRLIRVARKLCGAQSIMFQCDPLQHHGWFVLSEAQLNSYPEWYFPVELFDHAKSLFVDKGLELTISMRDSEGIEMHRFHSFCDAILQKIEMRQYPKNLYQLKSFLSAIMLLPSLYTQARDGRGIFKKYSFEAARNDFFQDEWAVMDSVSIIRSNWSSRISSAKHRLFSSPHPLSRYLARSLAPHIPAEIRQVLSADFYEKTCRLILAMKDNIYQRLH